jgi:putative chitinase
MSFFDDLVTAAAGLIRQVFGAPTTSTEAAAKAPAEQPESWSPADAPSVGVADAPPPAAPALPAAAGPRSLSAASFLAMEELRAIMPNAPAVRLAVCFSPLVAAMDEFAIDTPLRAAAFLAQLAHESSELRAWEENLNYGAPGLLATFPTHFEDLAVAAGYARQPERIANRVYANRMGNGPEESGDGWKYRGRGPIELTGLDGYRGIGAALGVDLVGNPDLAATPECGFRIAGHYWLVNGCNELADLDSPGAFEGITRKVNGGLTGLASREAYYARAKEALNA